MKKEIYLSIGEKEMLAEFQRMGASYVDAFDLVVKHKRKLLKHYEGIKYEAMVIQLRKELGEL